MNRAIKGFGLDTNSSKLKISNDLIVAVKKRKGKVLEKLAENLIIDENDINLEEDSSEYEDTEE